MKKLTTKIVGNIVRMTENGFKNLKVNCEANEELLKMFDENNFDDEVCLVSLTHKVSNKIVDQIEWINGQLDSCSMDEVLSSL